MNAELQKKLEAYGQVHLLKYYDELSLEQQQAFEEQLSSIDFSLLELCKKGDSHKTSGKYEPIDVLKLEEIETKKEHFYSIGLEAIKQCKVGAVLLAGGQGTRLGFDKPKGMLNVGLTKELYLFEILISNIMDVVKQADAWIPIVIMTSQKNHNDTVSFFEEHAYFGYNKDYVDFFIQEMVPSVDYNGNIYLEAKDKVSMSPNGNGGWFKSLQRSGLTTKLKNLGVEWLNVFSVDNVLQRIADPYFVGATIDSGYLCGSKVIKKAAPDEKVGVICKEDGKPSIVEYYELTEEMMNTKDASGEPAYNFGVTLNYLFQLDSLEKNADANIPVHIVEKKIPYIDETGALQNPTSPNGYKFETLVLDMIHMYDDVLIYEIVRNYEFAPIKNKTGVDSLESARELLKLNHVAL